MKENIKTFVQTIWSDPGSHSLFIRNFKYINVIILLQLSFHLRLRYPINNVW